MSQENAVDENKGIDVLLNGGKPIMDAATIPVQWFFSKEVAEKRPTHILIYEYADKEEYGNYDRNRRRGRRYSCSVSEAVKFLQLYTPGTHHLVVIAFAGVHAETAISDLMQTDGNERYVNSIRVDQVQADSFVEAYNDNHGAYDNVVVAATAVEFTVPEELFATKPKSKFGQKMWNYINMFYDKDPIDECAYRKRKIFAFTVQPFLVLIWLAVKHLIGGTVAALYILITSLFVWFWGWQPKPILKGMWQAFLWQDRYQQHDPYTNDWNMLRCKHYHWKRLPNGDLKTKKIVPWELSMLVITIGSLAYYLPKHWETLLNAIGLLFLSLIITGIAAVALVVVVLVISKFVDLTDIRLPKFWREARERRLDKRLIRKQERSSKKYIAEEQKKKRKLEEKQKREQQYQLWLEQNFNIEQMPKAVDLNKLPEPLFKPDRIIQHFYVNYWNLKTKVCRPFSR